MAVGRENMSIAVSRVLRSVTGHGSANPCWKVRLGNVYLNNAQEAPGLMWIVQTILYLRSCQRISKLDDTRLCTLLSQILLDQLQVQMGSGIPISTTYPMETGALRALIWCGIGRT